MNISLHTATVATYLQILPAVAGLVDKAAAHCAEKGLPDSALLDVRLAPDMWPLAKQFAVCAGFSAGAVKGLAAGVMGPDPSPAPSNFAEIKTLITDAISFLESVDPAEIDGKVGTDMRFEVGERVMSFTAEDFLLTFTGPNFYFHASTAYAILRSQGLAIGKMDFLGKPRFKT